jgi:methylenetetrahydrofolate dehydrogenase (NADP+)/methenyltetrahydrofolate cyclohydrolase
MVRLVDGKEIAEKVKDEITNEILALKGLRPNLAIILVGEREDSKLYVSLKEKESVKVGIDSHLYKLDSDVSEDELLQVINFLNQDETIDGILIQLPLPEGFNTDKIIESIKPEKDVDGFHPEHPDYIKSPVLAAIRAVLEKIKFVPDNKSACILYNSEVFGAGVKELLENFGLNNFLSKEASSQADLLITALGKPQSLKAADIKNGAIIIDISTVKVDGQVQGDIDFKSVKDKAAFLTPVPGGIGPMTIAFLLKNVLEIFKRRDK